MKNIIVKTAAQNAILTALYIVLVGSFLFYAPKVLGLNQPGSVFGPIALLCLFVFSASLTGLLMFGRPALWYLDGKKKEALSLLFWTLGIFLIVTIIALFLLYLNIR